MKSVRTWFLLAGFALAALGFFNPSFPAVLAADVTSTWSTATSGNWNVNASWTNVPALGGFPNNGNGGVATYDATISPVGSPYIVTLNTDVTVEDLLLNSANATLSHTSGMLTATGAINLTAGTYSLAGGTIAGSTVNATVPISLTNMGGTLSGVTVNGDLSFLPVFNSKVLIAGGTTFTAAHLAGNYSTIGFAPAQTLSGTIQFEGAGESSVTLGTPGSLTVGASGVIKTVAGLNGNASIGNGGFAYNADMALTNNGLISSQVSGRTLAINPATSFANGATGTLEAKSGSILSIAPTGTWTNAGMISVNAATLNLGGTFIATGGIGTWNNTGSTVNVTGTVDAGSGANTLTLNNATGAWNLVGGTISGGTLAFADGKTLNATGTGGMLSGVTVNGDLSFLPGFNSKVVIAGGTTFTTAHLAGNYSAIGFGPAQTLSGTIQFEGAGDQSSVTMSSAGTFTVGTTGVIKTLSGLTGDVSVGSGAFAYNAAMALTNNGLISSQVSGRTLTINPATSFTNGATGTLEAKSGGILTIAPTGAWTNAGIISVNAATVNLGGTFNATGGIGTWNNTGGTVNVTGTITNTGNTLTLNNSTGSWSMAGGTINGGTLAFADGKTLNATGAGGTLSGVTVNGDLSFSPVFNPKVVIAGGTTFTTAHLAGNYSEIAFAPAQTLSGAIQFEGDGIEAAVAMSSAGTFTVGTTGVIKTLSGLTGNANIGSGSYTYNAAMALVNNGLISSQVSGRTLTIKPATSFTNAGTLEAVNGGTLAVPLGYTQTAGITRINSGGTILVVNGPTTNTISVAGGRLEGNGTITANVANSGTISPGLSAGTLAITGDLTLASTSTLKIEIGGTTPGTQYDQLHVTGQVALGGTLDVSVINSFNLAAGNLFDVLDWGTLNGKFTSVLLPALPGSLTWYTSQLYNNGRVGVIDSNFLPGDFSRDAHINAADIQAMLAALTDLNSYKSTNSLTSAQLLSIGDIDLSGTLTNADMQALIGLLRNGGGLIAAVPEPASWLLMAIALPWWMATRRRNALWHVAMKMEIS